MINLLPKDEKNEIHAARTNIVLFNYIILLIIAIMFLIITCTSLYFLLNDIKKSAETQVDIKISNLQGSKNNQIGTVGEVIASAQAILNRQINYSEVITSVGSILPYGVIVDKISLSEDLLNEQLEIEFWAKSARVAPELIANLQKITIFSDIVSQQPILSTGNSPDYPVLITCKMMINRNRL
jgi:hypothetical protein